MKLARDELGSFSFQGPNTFFASPQTLPPSQFNGAKMDRVQVGLSVLCHLQQCLVLLIVYTVYCGVS